MYRAPLNLSCAVAQIGVVVENARARAWPWPCSLLPLPLLPLLLLPWLPLLPRAHISFCEQTLKMATNDASGQGLQFALKNMHQNKFSSVQLYV
jgi:hypothetical protein